MPKIDVEIDTWLQDAVAYELKNLVREKVKAEHGVSEDTYIHVDDPQFSYGIIDVHWGYGLHPNRTIGCESLSLKEVLNMIIRGNDVPEKEAMVGFDGTPVKAIVTEGPSGLFIGTDYDWTREELLQELKERKEAGESDEITHNFIWSIIQRAYDERDSATSEINNNNLEEGLFGRDSWHVISESPFTSDDIKKQRWSGSEEK